MRPTGMLEDRRQAGRREIRLGFSLRLPIIIHEGIIAVCSLLIEYYAI